MTVEDGGPSTTTPASAFIVTTYFFLLRVGEYTPTAAQKGQKKHTIPLRRQDIMFWKHARVIPPGTSLQTLLEADGVTINLANQKNGKKTQNYTTPTQVTMTLA
jgi:hypothetical protein